MINKMQCYYWYHNYANYQIEAISKCNEYEFYNFEMRGVCRGKKQLIAKAPLFMDNRFVITINLCACQNGKFMCIVLLVSFTDKRC